MKKQVPVEGMRQALGSDHNILFESNRIIDTVRPDVCLALAGSSQTELKPSFLRLLRSADALVSFGRIEIEFGRNASSTSRDLNWNRWIGFRRRC